MKNYLTLSINERINLKSRFCSPYMASVKNQALRRVFEEAEENFGGYYKSSPFPLGWD